MSAPDDTFTDQPVDTGFGELVTATVTEPAGLTPEGIEAAKSLVKMPDISPTDLARLGRDIAMNILEFPKVLQKYNLSQAQYDWLSTYNEFFKNVLSHLIKEWQGIDSTEKRVRAQSLAAFEELLPVLAGRMARPTEKLIEAIEGAKLLASVGGVDSKQQGPRSGGEGFSITIDLGADTRLTIGPQTPEAAGAGPAGAGALHTVAGREINGSQVQANPPRQGEAAPLRQLAAGPSPALPSTPVAGGSGAGTPSQKVA